MLLDHVGIYERAKGLLDHRKPFGKSPKSFGKISYLSFPKEEQHILRMMVKSPFSEGFVIPDSLSWLSGPIVDLWRYQQIEHRIFHPFVYVTVRHGIVKSVTDDLWHVDGFSMRVPHPTEQNYILSSTHPTEFLEQEIILPEDFDPMRHNIHKYFQDVAKEENCVTSEPMTLYGIDPYVIHRRPKVPAETFRTFFRISFIPIEILDDTCTINPLMPKTAPYGRGDIRDRLERYPV